MQGQEGYRRRDYWVSQQGMKEQQDLKHHKPVKEAKPSFLLALQLT